ncbi:hypothetical protein F2Q70_00045548 [Brassica cretica]|uniref:Uncharacterized protein n=1 Tax=Brassica cretica TaxID=69181 RepID=A0A8S9KD19_BRACR|nr:hypothetical protein F2Q70_00045548 [Brassica cretica]KAF2607616.1 hypothetical protein F2Q68_00046563 [Brassica cretica]
MAAAQRLRALQSQPENKVCDDCSQKNPQWGWGTRGGALAKTRSSGDIYSRSELEASAASKESFFAKRMAENECKPEGLPPSQGGKYVGFGSSRGDGGGDVFSVVSEGFGRLSLVAASAANVCCSDRNRWSSLQRTWGIMKGVMAIAHRRLKSLLKKKHQTGINRTRTVSTMTKQQPIHHQVTKAITVTRVLGMTGEKRAMPKKEAAPKVSQSVHHNGYGNSNSWDDWGEEKNSTTKKEAAPKVSASKDDDGGWAGWDDKEDDGYYQSAAGDKKSVGHNGKPDTAWTSGGEMVKEVVKLRKKQSMCVIRALSQRDREQRVAITGLVVCFHIID